MVRERLQAWITYAFLAILIGLVAYFGYVGFEGSRQLADPLHSPDCRIPTMFGWEYEAINYDVATDARLNELPDPTNCPGDRAPAGIDLETSDGIRVAGWYMPAANGIGPTGPTVVMAHGWGTNKSFLLDYAALLQPAYNLVLFDFRNHGQSSGDATTQGVREQREVRAILDWLEASKGPARVGLFGVSMGGVTVLNVAADEPRVAAVAVDSTHATMISAIRARLARAGHPLTLPGSWSILLGGLIRTGEDMSRVDAEQAIARIDPAPVLIIHGALDDAIGLGDGDALLAAAEAGATAAELRVCAEAGHVAALTACPDEYRGWLVDFFDRALAAPGA